MRTAVLATALELARVHGVRFAAFYLCEESIDFEVAVEVLTQKGRDRALQIEEVIIGYSVVPLFHHSVKSKGNSRVH
jgi:hypothetical protein